MRQWIRGGMRWLLRPTRIFGIVLFVFGLPGFIDNISGWSRWLDVISQFLNNQSSRLPIEWISDLLYNPLIYYAMLCTGILCFLEADRIGQGVRHIGGRLNYMVAIHTGQANFISEDNALHLIRISQWARARRAKNEKPRSFLDTIPLGPLHVDPARNARDVMFTAWCRLALSRFELEEQESVREAGQRKSYDEVKLRQWLTDRYHQDITEEFGPARCHQDRPRIRHRAARVPADAWAAGPGRARDHLLLWRTRGALDRDFLAALPLET
jgi:hypothetical protein